MKQLLLILFLIYNVFTACTHNKDNIPTSSLPNLYFKENFESGKKSAYADGLDTMFSGTWQLNNALTGNLYNDIKNGVKAIRLRGPGFIAMQFDVPNANAIQEVSFYCAKYSSDNTSKIGLYFSTDAGATWNMLGDTLSPSDNNFREISFKNLSFKANDIRFKIQNFTTTNTRVNIDDFKISTYASYNGPKYLAVDPAAATRDDNMAMGNPSNAAADTKDSNNFLFANGLYTASYNNAKGTPNWVSWHLSTAWLGQTDRCNCFNPDNTSLPQGYQHITTDNYTYSGFDRGHMCPSGDRTFNPTENGVTFLMDNILPQAADNNQGPWEKLETYCRNLAQTGNELYIISGGYGKGGININGINKDTIAGGKVQVPSNVWKVIVVLPVGNNDVKRINNSTRVIAVDMPNKQGIKSNDWGIYRTSVDSIELRTGYNFLSNISTTIQNTIEANKDTGPTM